MAANTEAVKRAIASLFTSKPMTPIQAMADVDATSKPSANRLFESGSPVVKLPTNATYNTAPLPQPHKRRSILPTGEAPQTREELQFFKHPCGYFVTIQRTKLHNKLCRNDGKAEHSVLKKGPAHLLKVPTPAQKVVAKTEVEAEQTVEQYGDVRRQVERQLAEEMIGGDEDTTDGSLDFLDDYESDGTASDEEEDGEVVAFSKYDVLRRRDDEDTVLGEDGDFSMYPDSSDED
ncbi:hypothetical protein CLAFUR4_09916 [Fulvia fulva]|nr:hypothetical protein CLAFUR4_09916 [Fulvia fulva]WPV33763.1 hypothetical protein CLAFUW7_09913 [Fulvia fulva]